MMDITETSKSLSELGRTGWNLFVQADALTSTREANKAISSSPDIQDAIAGEADRFELWTVNMGLLVAGHGSLDYRLRSAESLKATVSRFLINLFESLSEVLEYFGSDDASANGFEEAASADLQDTSLNVESLEEQELEGSLDSDSLLSGVKDSIDRLYKVSTLIRNPASRLASSKLLNHQEVDTSTGVDLLETFKPFDHDYVSSAFVQYRKTAALENYAASEPLAGQFEGIDIDVDADCPWEPIRTLLLQYRSEVKNGNEHFLIKRIAAAISRRRQQFAYWKKHREKLTKHTDPITRNLRIVPGPVEEALKSELKLREPSMRLPLPVPSITTASHLNVAQIAIRDNQSTVSVSEYAPSISPRGQDIVDFPPAPQVDPTAKFFECPYCFTLCPAALLGEKAWRAHLIHDLRPYLCTYEECESRNQLYDTRQDWISHEDTHRRLYRCPEHSDQTFVTQDDLSEHMRAEHVSFGDDISATLVSHAGVSASLVPDSNCPICSASFATARVLQNHIALHLERLSLFSLPRDVGQDDLDPDDLDPDDLDPDDLDPDDLDPGDKASNQVNAADDDSRAENFDDLVASGGFQSAEIMSRPDSPISASDSNTSVREAGLKHLEALRQNIAGIDMTNQEHAFGEGFINNLYSLHAYVKRLYEKRLLHDDAVESIQILLRNQKLGLGERHIVTLETMLVLALLLNRQHSYDDADEVLRQYLEILSTQLPEDADVYADLDGVRLATELAQALVKRKRYAAVTDLIRPALKAAIKMLMPSDETLLNMTMLFAGALESQEMLVEAENVLQSALESLLGAASTSEHIERYVDMSVKLASVLLGQNKNKDAEDAYFRAMELSGKKGKPESQALIKAVIPALERQDKYDEAEHCLRRVIESQKTAEIFDEREVRNLEYKLARFLERRGEYQEAESLYQNFIKWGRQVGENDASINLNSKDRLIEVLAYQAKWTELESIVRGFIHEDEQAFGLGHPFVVYDLANLAWVQEMSSQKELSDGTSDPDLVKERWMEALDRGASGNIGPTIAVSRVVDRYIQRGRYKEAEELILLMIEERQTALGLSSWAPEILKQMKTLTLILEHQGRSDEARELKLRIQELTTDKEDALANDWALDLLGSIFRKIGNGEWAEKLETEARCWKGRVNDGYKRGMASGLGLRHPNPNPALQDDDSKGREGS